MQISLVLFSCLFRGSVFVFFSLIYDCFVTGLIVTQLTLIFSSFCCTLFKRSLLKCFFLFLNVSCFVFSLLLKLLRPFLLRSLSLSLSAKLLKI